MEDNLTLGQVCSFIGASFIAVSVFSKSKKHMIILQLCCTLFCTLTNIILKGYSGIVANILLSTRHLLEIKGKLTRNITIVICVLMICCGMYFNSNGLFGIFPISAAVIFIIFSYIIKDVQNMRLLIAATHLQWSFYDFHIKSYPLFVLDLIIVVTSIVVYFELKFGKDIKNS